ncbi:DNA repair protein XRCC4 [Melipona quadrifasciata]|uniref:DNA repair protein XRCC4 n=1 Tax=Melipona quadrifasciata TaxID=166423 RepID=A0A0N0BEH6_9HYME|nr:DNA repair protein XRCC4 [Melipona quadrifasciata]
MTEVTAYEIFNKIDNKNYTLYVEWFNLCLKIMLLNSTIPPLTGEVSVVGKARNLNLIHMDTESINYFSSQLFKSSDEYVEETKQILGGKDTKIQFLVKDEIFEWKKNAWTLGRIKLRTVSDIQVICESFQQLLKFFQNIQEKITILEKENTNLINVNKELSSKIEEMIEIKSTMEQDLYKKFIIILNSKKKKIKELTDVIKEKENTGKSIFDVCTDEESEKEDEAVKNITISTKVSKKKSLNDISSKSIQETKKANHIITDKVIPKASTSSDWRENEINTLNKKVDENEEESCSPKKSKSNLNFEEESEEELFF